MDLDLHPVDDNGDRVLPAFAALQPAAQAALQDDLMALVARFNRAGDGSMVVPGEYLEVVVTRR